MGLLDGAIGALLDPIPFSSLDLLLLPMGMTAGSYFLVYMLLWLVAVSGFFATVSGVVLVSSSPFAV